MADSSERKGNLTDANETQHHQRLFHDFAHNFSLWFRALAAEPFYLYGEVGNISFTVGKSILDGAILYSMFSMAEREFQVAAILGVLTKYVYPAITIVSNVKASSFVDYVESVNRQLIQVQKLIRGLLLVAIGVSLGAILLVMCFPPFFKACFGYLEYKKYLLIVLFLFHHICDGSAQIVEGRIWFKLIEIKIRHGHSQTLAARFWGIHAMSQNIQLVIGQALL
jgi:hypothetical protein